MNINFNLIFDRTKDDVNYALSLERENVFEAKDLKGAYNFSDRNRVAQAINYLANLLNKDNYFIFGEAKQNFSYTDIIKPEDNNKVLDLIKQLKNNLPRINAIIPENLNKIDYIKANQIEKILYDLIELYEMLKDSWLYCGDGWTNNGNGNDCFDAIRFDNFIG